MYSISAVNAATSSSTAPIGNSRDANSNSETRVTAAEAPPLAGRVGITPIAFFVQKRRAESSARGGSHLSMMVLHEEWKRLSEQEREAYAQEARAQRNPAANAESVAQLM